MPYIGQDTISRPCRAGACANCAFSRCKHSCHNGRAPALVQLKLNKSKGAVVMHLETFPGQWPKERYITKADGRIFGNGPRPFRGGE